jgi:hypothetical protein
MRIRKFSDEYAVDVFCRVSGRWDYPFAIFRTGSKPLGTLRFRRKISLRNSGNSVPQRLTLRPPLTLLYLEITRNVSCTIFHSWAG